MSTVRWSQGITMALGLIQAVIWPTSIVNHPIDE